MSLKASASALELTPFLWTPDLLGEGESAMPRSETAVPV